MSTATANQMRCASCGAVHDPLDSFCRKCGAMLRKNAHPVHEQLSAIHKLSLRTFFGVVFLIVLIGWISLQLYHFGKGGVLGFN